MLQRNRFLTGFYVFLTAAALFVSALAWRATDFTVESAAFRTDSTTGWRTGRHPVFVPQENERTEVFIQFNLQWIHPITLQIIPDDCIESAAVNSIAIGGDILPYCNHLRGRTLLLPSVLKSGDNTLFAVVRNHGGYGSLRIAVPWYDPVRLGMLVVSLSLAVLLSRRLLRERLRTENMRARELLFAIIIVGILLRVLYFVVTPYLVRGHDVVGHIEYMEHMAKFWSIPAAKDGWQFYHPPLYYIVTGAWMAIGATLGRTPQMLYTDIQGFSLIVSIITFLLAGLWIGRLLFPQPRERTEWAIFAALLACFPSFIFFAGRINNDVLLLLWLVLSIGYLLRWWQRDRGNGDWVLSVLFLILGILTKSNALLLAPMPFLCLAMRKRMPWKQKGILAAAGLLLITVLTGWHFVLRFGIEKHVSVVANITHLNQSLRVDDSTASITAFNPLRIIGNPYNDPFDADSGRDFFWEYLFRSAFFGEFSFGATSAFLASLILAIALLLLPVIGIGVWQGMRNALYENAPMLFALALPLFGHVLYRQTAPFSSSQDFRYSIVTIIPLAYFLITGLRPMPEFFRRCCLYLIVMLVVFLVLFELGIGPE